MILKDSEVNYQWYKQLHFRLHGASPEQGKNAWVGNRVLRMLGSFAVNLARLILAKFLIGRKVVNSNRVWFLSYQYNLIASDSIYDRQYSDVPLQDTKYGCESSYLLVLNIGKSDFLHPVSLYNKITAQIRGLERDVVILDRFLTLKDLVSVYTKVFLCWIHLRRNKYKADIQKKMKINGIDCSDILYTELEKSFLGEIQRNLLVATMLNNAVKGTSDLLIITYGELLAANRPLYYFAKEPDPGCRFVTIQHATVYRNKLGFYHRRGEFNSGSNPSPLPDYYYVHGRQYYDILKEYYPENNIKIIGCLKYDKLYSIKSEFGSIREEITGLLNRDGRKVILIAPSVNDVEDILSCFRHIDLPQSWRVIISLHPIVNPAGVRKYIDELQLEYPIDFAPGIPTQKLLTISDLVVCGYSTVALEAAVFDVPSVRILPADRPPLTEDEEGVEYCYDEEDFIRFFSSFMQRNGEGPSNDTRKLAYDFFYKIDGKVHQRFWESLLPIIVNK